MGAFNSLESHCKIATMHRAMLLELDPSQLQRAFPVGFRIASSPHQLRRDRFV